MQILFLELENVKSYTNAHIVFAGGVNAIVGQNGAGKSTILEAIGFALFDSLPYKHTDFVREGARSGTVAVTFLSSYDERPYRVERRFGGVNHYGVFDPELQAKVCEGKVDVLAFIRRHTGADPAADLGRLFGDAIGVAQGNLTSVFSLAPAQRKATFDSLLQVDEYRTAYERLLEPRRLLRERQQALEVQAVALQSRLDRLPTLEAAVQERATSLAEVEARQAVVTARLQVVQEQRQELEELRQRIDQLAVSQAQASQHAESTSIRLRDAQRALSEAEQARDMVDRNIAGYSSYQAAQTRKGVLDEQGRERQAHLAARAEADKLLALSGAELQRIEETLGSLALAETTIVALAAAVAQQGELDQALAQARQDAQRLAELDRLIARLQQQAAELHQRTAHLAAQLAEAGTLLAGAEHADQQVAIAREAVAGQRADQAGLKVEADQLKAQSTALGQFDQATCPVCEQPLTSGHRDAMLARNEERLLGLRRRHLELQTKIKQAEAELQAQSEEQKRLQTLLRSLPRPAELSEAQAAVHKLEQELIANQALRAGLAQAPARVDELSAALAALGNPRQQSAVAAQQAAQRPQVEAKRAQTIGHQDEARQRLAHAEHALARYATLDDELAAVDAALQVHQDAYHAVLSFRTQAESVEARAAEVQHWGEELTTARATAEVRTRDLQVSRDQFDPTRYHSILSEDQGLRAESGGLHARAEMLRREQARDAAEIALLCAQLEELSVLRERQRVLGEQDAALETVRNLLRQAGPYITQAVIRQVSLGAAHIFGELMQDYSRHLRWNEEYGITLDVDGAIRQFVQLSGGEQMSAALAVRLSLVREMSNIDVAFFDEPTANMDDVRREALARQIVNIKGFRQLFVISHDDTFEQATQNQVRVKRDGSTSSVES